MDTRDYCRITASFPQSTPSLETVSWLLLLGCNVSDIREIMQFSLSAVTKECLYEATGTLHLDELIKQAMASDNI